MNSRRHCIALLAAVSLVVPALLGGSLAHAQKAGGRSGLRGQALTQVALGGSSLLPPVELCLPRSPHRRSPRPRR